MADYLPDTQVFEAPSVGTPNALQQKSVFNAPSMPRPSVGGYKSPKFGGDQSFGSKTGVNKNPVSTPTKVRPAQLPNTPKSGRTYQDSRVLPDRGATAARRPMINPTQQPTI